MTEYDYPSYQRHCRWRFQIKTENEKYPPPHINPWLRLSIYMLMTFLTGKNRRLNLFSGCVYWGWNGIQAMLYKAGAFEELCIGDSSLSYITIGNENFIDCGSRKSSINNLFTIAYSSQLISSIFTGLLLDFIGPKLCFMIGQFTNMISWMLISSIPKNGLLLRICFFLIGSTTECLYMPLTTVSHYFPNNQLLILSSMGAVRSMSILIPILLSKIFTLRFFKPEDLYKVGIGYSVICNFSCLFIGSLIIQTKFYVVHPEVEPENLKRENTTTEFNEIRDDEIKFVSCFGCIGNLRTVYKHPQFVEFVLLFIISSLFLSSIEFVNKSHRDLLLTTSGDSASDTFKYVQVLSFIPAPFIGFLMDRFGAPLIYMFIQLTCLSYFLCSLSNYYFLKLVACVFFLFSCSMCLTDTYCYIRQRFCPLHFGVLNGICFVGAGLFSLTNIPLYNLAAKRLIHLSPNNFKPVVFIHMGYLLTCIIMSISLVFKTKAAR